MSQPAREFVVKIIELSLWSSDLLIGHFLLIILSIPVLIPYADRIHATLLCMLFRFSLVDQPNKHDLAVWLRPSKQIRAPLYSIKQKRLRRWIVIKYGLTYLTVVIVFAALLVIREYLLTFLVRCRTDRSGLTAAVFRDQIKVNCTLCTNL